MYRCSCCVITLCYSAVYWCGHCVITLCYSAVYRYSCCVTTLCYSALYRCVDGVITLCYSAVYRCSCCVTTVCYSAVYRCGHCKRLAPTWEELGATNAGKEVTIARVDCTQHKTTCQSQSVSQNTLSCLPGVVRV